MSGLALWRLRTATRRSGTQWRLLAVVTAVALLVGTLLSSLSILLVATERLGVRAALTQARPLERETLVTATDLRVSVDSAVEASDAAVAELLGPSSPASSTVMASSDLQAVALPTDRGEAPVLSYLGRVDGVAERAELEDGAWPEAPRSQAGPDGGATIPVAIPAVMAEQQDLSVGDTLEVFTYSDTSDVRVVEVVGTFTATGLGSRYWSADSLRGEGVDPAFVVPGTGGQVTTTLFGPLVVTADALATNAVPVERMVARYDVDFGDVEAADVAPLLERLDRVEELLPAQVGPVAESVRVASRLAPTVQEVATALVVTRASVLVIGLLLAVLAVAALLQTARLLAETRSGEQNLMRARGASGRQLLGLAGTEALWLAVVTTAVSPLLARQVYLLIASRPAMSAAGMDADPGLPLLTWFTALGAALLFALVLVAPLLRRATTFVEGEQARARPDRRSVLTRSGVDLALVVVAAVAYWQLQSYRSPLAGAGPSMRIDPVLVAGPAIVLLAGSLLAVRLVPAASRLTERIGSQGRGIVGPLAAWEVGRRSGRATAAVLLLTLALAVGTFSQSFLTTWRQSQADQATFQVGPPVRLEDVPSATMSQRDLLSPVGGTPAQPVLRATGALASPERSPFGRPTGPAVEVVALTAEARQMLDVGRLSGLGGAEIGDLPVELPTATGIELPGDVRGLSASILVGDPDRPLAGAAVILRMVLEDSTGLLSTLDLATVPVDGVERSLDALIPGLTLDPDDEAAARMQGPLRIVGLQSVMYATSADEIAINGDGEFSAEILVRDLSVLGPAQDPDAEDPEPTRTAVDVPRDLDWYAMVNGVVPLSVDPPEGWQLGSRLSGRLSLFRSGVASVAQIGWPATADVPIILSASIADRIDAEPGQELQLVLDDAIVPVVVVDVAARIPSSTAEDAVVVDQAQVARVAAQQAASGSAVSEWWVDVPDEEAEAYLTGLGENASGTPVAERATAETRVTRDMQEHPLRVATQGSLWLVTLAAAVLAAVGFAIHTTVSLRAREVEFAQLRAIGLARRRLTAVVGLESLLLCLLGSAFGIALGVMLGWLVGPLVAVSASGLPPVPGVLVLIPWGEVALFAVEVVVVLAVVVLVVARSQRRADPASVLRLGDER